MAFAQRELPTGPLATEDARVETPKTRYAQSVDGTYIAYQVFGEGPDLLLARPWISHLELEWEDPIMSRWLRGLARLARVVSMDQWGYRPFGPDDPGDRPRNAG